MAFTLTPLAAGGALRYDAAFLGVEAAESLFAVLVRELSWQQREIVLFGRRIVQPRLIAWAGKLPYRYSGQTLDARPFDPALQGVLTHVSRATGVPFNHVLLNRYRDGRDSMGFHSDDEPELGEEPVIATLSLGATRRFVVVPRRRGLQSLALELSSGSLLVMDGACQARYRHGIPKSSAPVEERISVTFRRVLAAPRVRA